MTSSQEARSSSFQLLKPTCIKLSEIALRLDQFDQKEINEYLEALLHKLKTLPVLDAKLADYAFFPLSYIIKNAQSISARSLSLAVRCLEVLIQRGWQSSTDEGLVRELLFFLTIQITKAKQDDLQLSILACLNTMLIGMNIPISVLFTHKDSTPLAGQLIDTLLEIVKDSPATEIQISGITTLRNLVSVLNDEEMLRTFLPGLVSHLSNILRPQVRRSYRVYVKGIDTLEILIRRTLADSITSKSPTDERISWRKATSAQILLALSNVITQRYHKRFEVLEALIGLCVAVLDDCLSTLENCIPLMLETVCMISSQTQSSGRTVLDRLVANQAIHSALQELVYKWLQSLPRRFQSSDGSQVDRSVALICEGCRALQDSNVEASSLGRELFQSITIVARLLLNENKPSKQIDDLPDLTVRDLVVSNSAKEVEALGPLAAPYLMSLEKLLVQANSLQSSEENYSYFEDSNIASLWTMTRTLSLRTQAGAALQEFTLEDPVPGYLLDMALDRSLSILTETLHEGDWRIQALSLEVIALIAKHEKQDFRVSLVDALFPILELIGAKNPFLQQYAVAALNVVSVNCGYADPGDMIVRNVDYLVNAVALKFNSFDISPQAVQVLLIMLELSGPALIPYLDDLVESIFGALAAYHGYPRLVETMFSALAAIVRHGSSDASSIMAVPRIEHAKRVSKKLELAEIPEILHKIKYPPPPADLNLEAPTDESRDMQQTSTPSTELDKAEKAPKIYTMVASVLRLSQHYLTHKEPYLRQKLLDLVTMGCNSLSRNEELFLPLVNDLWPVIILRLYDQEAIVCLAAMQTLSAIFIGAGDFVSTRIQNEWPRIRTLFRSLQDKTRVERQGKSGRGTFSYNEKLFDGMVDLLVQFILHVKIKSSTEDELFAMLGPWARSRKNVRDALEVLNADALWLTMELPKFMRPTPQMEGFRFLDVSAGHQGT